MLAKIVFLFLAFIALLGILGKLHWIGGPRLKQVKCKACGRRHLAQRPCKCGNSNG